MTELEKKAAKEDLKEAFGRHVHQAKRGSRLGRGLEHLMYGPTSYAAALPGRAASNLMGGFLFGPKNRNVLSPMHGERLRPVKGTKGLEEITRDEYKDIKSGARRGTAYKFRGEGHLMPVYYKRKFVPGGAVGLVRKHPLLSAGGGLLAYYLMKDPQGRAMAQGMMPRPNMGVSPVVGQQWQESNAENPFQRKAWG